MSAIGIKSNIYTFHILKGHVSKPLIDRSAGSQSCIQVKLSENPEVLQDVGAYIMANPTVTLDFKPLFKGTQSGDQFNGPGVEYNTVNGVLEVLNVTPTEKLRNFIVEVKLSEPSVREKYTYVRYEIHDSIVNAWLTPNVLSVPKNVDYQKFSIYAEFDDGIVGDITYDESVIWSSPNNNRNVFPEGSILVDVADNINDEIEITATLPASFQNKVAKGKLKVAAPWDSTNPFTINLVNTGNSPGYDAKNEVPNILFISEGYVASSESDFNAQVDNLVEKLATDSISTPFNILSKSINYWKLFIPSPDASISWSPEVTLAFGGVKRIPNAIKTPKPTTDTEILSWSVENLLFFAGLPVPEQKSNTVSRLKTSWESLLRLDDNPSRNNSFITAIPDQLIQAWKSLGDRRLLEENSTALGFRKGVKPKAVLDFDEDYNSLDFDSKRYLRCSLDKIFINAVDSNSRPLSNLWEIDEPCPIDDGLPQDRKKDFDRVIIMANGLGGRAINKHGYMVVPVNEEKDFVQNDPAGALVGVTGPHKAIKLRARNTRSKLSLKRSATFIHELCHSFGVSDEYGIDVPDLANAVVSDYEYDGSIADMHWFSNLEIDAAIKATGSINGDLIKWRWHRIEKCAVLTKKNIDLGSQNIKIHTKDQQSQIFDIDDEVLLRFRKLDEVIARTPRLSKLLKITSKQNDHLVCELVNHNNSDFTDALNFDVNNIIYKPKKAVGAAYNASNYPFARMITKNVSDFMTANNRPLTPQSCVIDNEGITAPDALPVIEKINFRNKPNIIGLYAGGLNAHCKIYHPSGTCLMRQQVIFSRMTELCAVCRYVITEWIDPSLHPEVDALYTIYPEL